MTIASALIIIVAIAGITLAILQYLRLKEVRALLEFSQTQIDELQDAVLKNHETHEAAQRRATDQSRRIAWLESRLNKPRPASGDILDEAVVAEAPKFSMTERRHRVVGLANRGSSPEAIASALGMFKGEVELILSLNRAAAGAK